MNKKLIPAYVLSAFNLILIAVSVGLSLYTVIFLPIFFIALFFTIKGSLRGWFVWVGCICFLIYFSVRNISSLDNIWHLFIVYHPAVSLIIFLTSAASLFVALMLADIKSNTSPLMNKIPVKLTASLLLLLVFQMLWKVIVDIYGFEYGLGFRNFLREVYS